MNESIYISVNIFIHCTCPYDFIEDVKSIGINITGYAENMSMISIFLPIKLMKVIKCYPNILDFRVTTSAYQLKQKLQANNRGR